MARKNDSQKTQEGGRTMLNVSSLQKVSEGIESNLKKMQSIITPAEQKIQEMNQRHGNEFRQEVLNKKISEIRASVSDQLYAIYGEINAAAGEAAKSEKFYRSTPFMLSRVKFSDDDGINASMKLAAISEFEHMEFQELVLVAEAAKAHKQFARLWIANLAARSKSDQRDKADIQKEWVSFEGAETPEQVSGLGLLKKISEGRAKAELMMRGSVISPTPLPPREKLQLAREANIP